VTDPVVVHDQRRAVTMTPTDIVHQRRLAVVTYAIEIGNVSAAARCRLRLESPGLWETTFRGRLIHVYPRRSMALSGAEHHHREVQRSQQITKWAVLAGVALLVSIMVVDRLTDPLYFLLFAVAVWTFLRSFARATASATQNLLDP
jgi:hypothetical protein